MEEREVLVAFILDPDDTEEGLWEWLQVHCPYLFKSVSPKNEEG
ncbi:MAG TPA: hypothetical protein VFU96_02240 [Acidimicrobiia bacterium]|nr:hypothetical protein [Acidimicrobiia bacterium]